MPAITSEFCHARHPQRHAKRPAIARKVGFHIGGGGGAWRVRAHDFKARGGGKTRIAQGNDGARRGRRGLRGRAAARHTQRQLQALDELLSLGATLTAGTQPLADDAVARSYVR